MVRHLASLSRLTLKVEEEQRLGQDMQEILTYFKMIDKANVESLKPEHDVLGKTVNDLREDTPAESDPDSIMKIVPHKRGRYVKAPRVF